MQTMDVTTLTTTDLLEQLARLDRKQQPRVLQQLRAELVRRDVRYREQQIAHTQPPQYQITELSSMRAAPLPAPIFASESRHSFGRPWWFSLLLLSSIFISGLVNGRIGIEFEVVGSFKLGCIFVAAVWVELWLFHSRRHGNYLAFWLADETVKVSAYAQRFVLHSLFFISALLLANPFGWLGHQILAQPQYKQVLVVDMQRDFALACPFRVILQVEGTGYRTLCIPTEVQYEALRPNDRITIRGHWSWFGISG